LSRSTAASSQDWRSVLAGFLSRRALLSLPVRRPRSGEAGGQNEDVARKADSFYRELVRAYDRHGYIDA
jgi:hypothetical protein